MAEQWGIGEITEEDVDDLFRAAGIDPAVQTSITLADYREIVQNECDDYFNCLIYFTHIGLV